MLQRDSEAELPDPLGCPVRMLRAVIVAVELSQFVYWLEFHVKHEAVCDTCAAFGQKVLRVGRPSCVQWEQALQGLEQGFKCAVSVPDIATAHHSGSICKYIVESFQEHTPTSGPGKTPWLDGRLQMNSMVAPRILQTFEMHNRQKRHKRRPFFLLKFSLLPHPLHSNHQKFSFQLIFQLNFI
jgi:hypothetical protein